jgi:hypothetical protein
MKITDKRCPVCHSNFFTVCEHFDSSEEYNVENGVIDCHQYEKTDGDITFVKAICKKCKHEWFLRDSALWFDFKELPNNIKYKGKEYNISGEYIKLDNESTVYNIRYIDNESNLKNKLFDVCGYDKDEAGFKMMKKLRKYKII